MQDVAQLAGVSMMTVSRVLGNEVKVREATRKKVQDAIAELGYKPNISARSLASSKSHLIAFLYQRPREGYMGQLLVGAMAKCQTRGYNLVVSFFDDTQVDISSALEDLIRSSRIDGVILPPPFADTDSVLDILQRSNVPTIRISPERKECPFPSVCMDETQAVFEMTEYLIEQGHRKIGFIKGHPDHSGTYLRFRGFKQALEKHGVSLPAGYVQQGFYNFKSGFSAAESLLAEAERPTAIFACNDEMAAGTVAAVQKNNLSVPGDVSVVGFDDAPIASSIWPGLTTVHQPIVEMAERAADMLIDQLTNKEASATNEHRLRNQMDFNLVLRDTVAPPTA